MDAQSHPVKRAVSAMEGDSLSLASGTFRRLLASSAALMLSGCTASEPKKESPPTEESCLRGLGEPSDASSQYEIDLDWMTQVHHYNARVECLDFPELRISSGEEGMWPIDYIRLNVASSDGQPLAEQLSGPLNLSIADENIGTFDPVGVGCTIGDCGPLWEIDVSEFETHVSPEDALFVDFTLASFEDPSGVEALWDGVDDRLFIYAEAGYFSVEENDTGYGYNFFNSGASVNLTIDAE